MSWFSAEVTPFVESKQRVITKQGETIICNYRDGTNYPGMLPHWKTDKGRLLTRNEIELWEYV